MLEPESLKAFVAVAEQGHFMRAADVLGVAQPVVSKRLKRLEDRLGMRLVERNKKSRVQLTREGELFLPEARSCLAMISRTERMGRKLAQGAAGPVRVGFVFSAVITGVLPDLIRALRASFPGIEILPALMETPEQLSAIADGRIDLGIMRPRPFYPDGVTVAPLHSEDVVVALCSDNRLAGRHMLCARDIVGNRLIIPQFHEEVGLIGIIRELAASCRATMPEIIRTADFVTAAGLAAADVGLAIAPRSLSRLALDNLCFRDISDYAGQLDLVLALRADAPASYRDLPQGF